MPRYHARSYGRLGTTREIAQQRVLVVDDDHEVCTSLRDAIRAWLQGVEVLTAPSAERAIEILDREPVNLIIADQWMSGIDGIELLCRVKERYRGIPAILMTGRPHMDLVVDGLRKTQMCTFLPKPLRLESVIAAVAGLLHLNDAHDGRSRAIASALRGLRDELHGLQTTDVAEVSGASPAGFELDGKE